MRPPCVILAGGRSSRMGGGDKGLLPLAGRPILSHVLQNIALQACATAINSNSQPELFQSLGFPVLPDVIAGFQGPLAGLLTGMRWAQRHHPNAPYLLSVPCDTPFLPGNLVEALGEDLRRSGKDIAIAADQARTHPVIGLWPVDLAERLADDLTRGIHGVHHWLRNFRVCETIFPEHHFQNINTRNDLAAAENRLCRPFAPLRIPQASTGTAPERLVKRELLVAPQHILPDHRC